MTMHRGIIRAASAILLGALALTAVAAPVAQAGDPAPCRVSNVTQDTHGRSFAAMVDAAVDGDRLTVRGRCLARNVTIRADVTIRGIGDPRPVLTGRDRHRVIRVSDATTVTLRHMVVAEGARDEGGGGGIWNAGSLTLVDMRVRHNRAGPSNECGVDPDPTCDWRRDRGDGGGGVVNDGTMRMVRTRVTHNEAGQGAGIDNRGTLTLVRSLVARNVAGIFSESEGGGIQNSGTLSIRRSTVARNWIVSGEGYTAGGGIFNSGALTVTDSTVSHNHAVGNNGEYGGGIANGFEYGPGPGDVEIVSSTVAYNRGGGIYSCTEWCEGDPGSTTIRSSILARNVIRDWSLPRPLPWDCGGVFSSGGHNLIGVRARGCRGFVDGVAHDRVGTRSDPIDARLGPLGRNGGGTPTHALLPGSPAIDEAGRAPCATPRDQRGVPRPQGGRCDTGAFERR